MDCISDPDLVFNIAQLTHLHPASHDLSPNRFYDLAPNERLRFVGGSYRQLAKSVLAYHSYYTDIIVPINRLVYEYNVYSHDFYALHLF